MKRNHKSGAWKCLALSMVLLLSLSMTAHGDLLLRYPLDEGAGVDVLDVSGNENHAQMNNMDDSSWVAGKEAKFGTALAFDGTNDYVRTVDVFSKPLDGDFTVSMWFTASVGTDARVFTLNQGEQLQFNIRVRPGEVGIDDTGGVAATSTAWGSAPADDGEWHHFAFVREGLSVNLYFDGELLLAPQPLQEIVTMDHVTIAARQRTSGVDKFMAGNVDEFSIYNEALDINTIRVIAEPPSPTIEVATVAELEAAAAAANPGDTIDIAAGTFVLTEQIAIKDGVTYQGAGADLTVIDGGGVTRAFFGWGDRGATNGQVDANGDSVPNATGPKGWVLDGLTIQNCVTGADNRQDILGAARDLLNNYTGAPYTLATAQEENGGITDNPGWFDVLSGGADDNLTDAELQAYLDGNPVGSAGHLVVNDDKRDDGGAVCILNGAEGTIRNCMFSSNTADGHGGAINADGVALVVAIEDCAFDLNTSGGDAAVNLTSADSNFTVTGCSFTECTAGDDAGALSMESGERTIYTVTDCTFTGNYCADDGGAIKADGDDSTNVWTNCTFIGNTAGDDGAAVRYSPDRAELTMTNCTFIENGKDADGTVVGDDGVWQCKDDDAGSVTFENCLFADNACNDDRLIELKAAFAILNCTFINNVAGDKALIAVRGAPWDSTGDGVGDVTTDDSIISNCLFINNTMLSDSNVIGDTRDNIFAPTVTNCLFFGNLDKTNPANNTNNDSTEVGTIDVSAVTDAAQIVVDPAGDYHLAAGSPAIDASDPATATATDIEGTPAVGVRDVGAYEAP